MKITGVIETRFSGSHTVPGHPVCGELHGHTWRVRVELTTDEKDLDPGAVAFITDAIRVYNFRDLNRFLPGVETHSSGLGAFFREQLSDYPVSAIEVIAGDAHSSFGARLEWVVR